MKTKLNHSLIGLLIVTLLLSASLTTSGASAAVRNSYLVQGPDTDTAVRWATHVGGEITSRLDIIHGVGVLLTPAMVDRLKSEGSLTITPNGEVKLISGGGGDDEDEGGHGNNSPATDYADVVGADLAWRAGVTGQGVTVAVVDTGRAVAAYRRG